MNITTQKELENQPILSRKISALKKFLDCDESDLKVCAWDNSLFEFGDKEYLILDEEEASIRAAEQIKNDLWAFRASYIAKFMNSVCSMNDRETRSFIKFLEEMQEKLCESCNSIMEALVGKNIDRLINSALADDGMGHFLSPYDHKEHEQDEFFIYRTN